MIGEREGPMIGEREGLMIGEREGANDRRGGGGLKIIIKISPKQHSK